MIYLFTYFYLRHGLFTSKKVTSKKVKSVFWSPIIFIQKVNYKVDKTIVTSKLIAKNSSVRLLILEVLVRRQ